MGEPSAVGPEHGGPADNASAQARLDALIARLAGEHLEVLPFYHDLRNQIVRPLNLHVETRYFFRRWKPILGPVLTLLIMELRDRCYYNPRTGERRDYCWPSQEELARAIGVSTRTVIRALQDPRAQKFIRIQHRYRYDPVLGKKVRTSSAYVVAMDDPLLPEDEPKLTRLVAEQILARETTERHQLQIASPPDLADALAARSNKGNLADLTDNLTPSGGTDQTDNLSDINITDNMSEEEILSGHDSYQKESLPKCRSTVGRQKPPLSPSPPQGEKIRRDSPPSAGERTGERAAPLVPEPVVRAYQEANGRTATPLELRRLAELIERFEPAACQAQPPGSGAAWVLAAIIEAVDSGSSFVAPRRIATICERWQRRSQGAQGMGGRGSCPPGIEAKAGASPILLEGLDDPVSYSDVSQDPTPVETETGRWPVSPRLPTPSSPPSPLFLVDAAR